MEAVKGVKYQECVLWMVYSVKLSKIICVTSLQQQLAQLQKEKSEILKNLALYYFTFVDVMEFKVRKHWNKTCLF